MTATDPDFETITPSPPPRSVAGGANQGGEGTFSESEGPAALFIPWHWTEIFRTTKVHGAGRWAIAVVLTHARCATHQNCRRDQCEGGQWLVVWGERWAGREAGVSKNTVGDAKRKMIGAGWFRVHKAGDHTKQEADVIDVTKLVLSQAPKRKGRRPRV